ncbi:MAG: hypothetical protein COT73_02670, partial [Bdellovibrio sp. CG10_big_fil_rev_8_21_14_0_10_47_8]
MKAKTRVLLAVIFIGGLTSCRDDDGLWFVGIDKNSKEVAVRMPPEMASEQMLSVINQASTQTLLSLESMAASKIDSHWKPSEVEVGLGLSVEGGIQSVMKLGGSAGISLL